MNIVLWERDVAATGFQLFLELSRQIPTKCPIVFLLAPGSNDEVDRGVAQLCDCHGGLGIRERSLVRRDDPFDDRDRGSDIVAVGGCP